MEVYSNSNDLQRFPMLDATELNNDLMNVDNSNTNPSANNNLNNYNSTSMDKISTNLPIENNNTNHSHNNDINNNNNNNSNNSNENNGNNNTNGAHPNISSSTTSNSSALPILSFTPQERKEFFEEKRKEKETYYNSRVQKLNEEMDMLSKGTHREYITKINKLENLRNKKIDNANRHKQIQIEHITRVYEASKKQANDEFELDVNKLKERMQAILMDRMKRLEDEKNDIITPPEEYPSSSIATRKLRRRNQAKTGGPLIEEIAPIPKDTIVTYQTYKKRLPVLSINFVLREEEIYEDIGAISKSIDGTTRPGKKEINSIKCLINK